jgi:hypothetical protein
MSTSHLTSPKPVLLTECDPSSHGDSLPRQKRLGMIASVARD